MKQYGPNDIVVVDDAISHLQRRPTMYLQGSESPTAAQIANAIMGDIFVLNALPARVERDEDWWVISAEKDWLAESGFGKPPSLFFRLCPFPARGREACRSECFVTAYADDAVIAGCDGIVWIKGDRARRSLPTSVTERVSRPWAGRILAFTLSESPHPFAPVIVWFA